MNIPDNTRPLMDPQSPEEIALRKKMEESRDFIDRSERELAPVSHRGRLPENLFVNQFLPFFTGRMESTPENPVVNTWVAIAGSPASEVDIIDENNNVLYSTPPLFDTTLIDVAADTGPTIGQIMREHKQIQSDTPDAAKQFLEKAMAIKLKGMLSDKLPTGFDTDRWKKIGERYGFKSEQATETDKESGALSGDDLNYDEIS